MFVPLFTQGGFVVAKKLLKESIRPVIVIDFAVMAVFSVLLMIFKNVVLGAVCLLVSVGTMFFHYYVNERTAEKKYDAVLRSLREETEDMVKEFEVGAPLLMCLVDGNANLLWANDKFVDVFDSQEKFNKLAGKKFVGRFFDNLEFIEEIYVDEKCYSVSARPVTRNDGSRGLLLFWQNVTARETIKQLYMDSRPCAAIIEIDNYDAILEAVPVDEQSSMIAILDKTIRAWAHDMNAAAIKFRSSRYAVIFEQKYLEEQRKTAFPILNQMHEIAAGTDFPPSLSIGIALGETGNAELLSSATDALEFAQARGGDQAVLRYKGGQTEYYGGALPTVEKRNKGKSRIVAHSLSRLIEGSDQVFIMGHKNPDLDALGAAIGIYALCKNSGKTAAIVLDEPSDGIEDAYKAALSESRQREKEGEYPYYFISQEEALQHLTDNTLVMVLDCHKAVIAESEELVDRASRLAVIDHHRKSQGAIEGADLVHMESYASSTSELVSEILQYSGDKGNITKFEAELLLAGIILDTKSFTTNTGVRTFDAAAWLRRCGADNQVIKEYFKVNLEMFRKKSNIIASTEVLSNGIAVAYTKDSDSAMQMLVAQVADELLDMKGVEASFVAGRTEDKTTISARSSGKVNVQVIMEALGGGGHQNVAAAQVIESPEEAIAKVVTIMRENEMI